MLFRHLTEHANRLRTLTGEYEPETHAQTSLMKTGSQPLPFRPAAFLQARLQPRLKNPPLILAAERHEHTYK
jgi:hypothetical protein